MASGFFHLRVVDRTHVLINPDTWEICPRAPYWETLRRGTWTSAYEIPVTIEQVALDRDAYQLGVTLLQGGSGSA